MRSGDKQVFQIQKSFGLELGRFRLKEDMSEAALQEAYQAMVTHHLSKQSGWCGQHLVKLGDGIFLDVAFALTEDHAKAICASWRDQSVCDAFLAFIEPISMEFGTAL
jgi:hypothetical protein